jgi:hypothetical protein
VYGSLWHFAIDTPGRRHFRHLTFKQEGSEADFACTDLCKKRALVLQESVVLLEGVVVKGRPHCQGRDPVTIRWFARVLYPVTLPVHPQDHFRVLVL